MCKLTVVFLIILFSGTGLFAQDSENVELISTFVERLDDAVDVDIQDDIAFVCTMSTGLRILDVSNPEQLEFINCWSLPGYSVLMLILANSFAFTFVETDIDNEACCFLAVLDISDPTQIDSVNIVQIDSNLKDIFRVEDNLYTLNTVSDERNPVSNLGLIDISDPVNPALIWNFEFEGNADAVFVEDNLAFISNHGSRDRRNFLTIYDISDPENIDSLGSIQFDSENSGNNRIYVRHSVAFMTINNNELYAIDVSSPENPEIISTIEYENNWWGGTFEIEVVDNLAYISGFYYGEMGMLNRDAPQIPLLHIVDISDPENLIYAGGFEPEEIIEVDEIGWGGIYSMDIVENVAYCGITRSFVSLDISNIEDIEEIDFYNTEGRVQSICVSNGFAFIADGYGGLKIFDVSDPENTEQVGCFQTQESAQSVVVNGEMAYLVETNRLTVLSIEDPENPQEVAHMDTERIARDITISGDYVYLAGSSGLYIISIVDPENLIEVGYYQVANATSVKVYDENAYVVKKNYSLHVISISDKENPIEVGRYILPDETEFVDIDISGDYAFISGYGRDDGLYIISISNPENPESVGCYNGGTCYGVAVSDNYAYIACWDGLHVVSIEEPGNAEKAGYYNTPGVARNIALSEDGLIYVSDGISIGIYRFTDPAGVNDPATSIPIKFSLSPVYPNPFNSTTTIEYTLPHASEITLSLYNLSGRKVKTLVNGRMQAGVHQTILDVGDMASGLYFVKLAEVGQSVTQKIMLVK